MQSSRFDALTRWTARRTTRRSAITQAGWGIAAALGFSNLAHRTATAQVASPEPEPRPDTVLPISLLFIQHAGPTYLTPGLDDIHTLTMTEVAAQTLYFSDRPHRITGHIQTIEFAETFDSSFSDSPPNATLVAHFGGGAGDEEAVVLTLLSASYEPTSDTLTYEVTLLDAELIEDRSFEPEALTLFDSEREYVEASLFIDNQNLNIPPGTEYGMECADGIYADAGTDCCPLFCNVTGPGTYDAGAPDICCATLHPAILEKEGCGSGAPYQAHVCTASWRCSCIA